MLLFDILCISFLPEFWSLSQFRKSKLVWDQLVSYVTHHTRNKMGHGNSLELALSNAMTRFL
jgi:hypothetical protein